MLDGLTACRRGASASALARERAKRKPARIRANALRSMMGRRQFIGGTETWLGTCAFSLPPPFGRAALSYSKRRELIAGFFHSCRSITFPHTGRSQTDPIYH